MLPVRSSNWMNLSLRLTTCCLKYMFSRYEDIDLGVLFQALLKKFIYLSTRQNAQLRYYDMRDNVAKGDNIVCALFMSENIQQYANKYPLTVSEWVDYEISVFPDDDSLTHLQRYEYFSWILYSYFLSQKQEDLYSIASTIVQRVVKYDIRCNLKKNCNCDCCEPITSPSNSRTVLINLVQELTSRFPPQTKEACKTLPWLPQQLMNLLSETDDEIKYQCIIQLFFRVSVCLPGYLMYGDTFYRNDSEISLNPITQFINKILVPYLCEGLFLPASITIFLGQGLFQVSKADKAEEMLNEMCEICPVFMMSLMRYYNLVKPFLPKDFNPYHPLQLVNARENFPSHFAHIEKPRQQAVILYSIAISSTDRDVCSVLKEYLAISSDVGLQYKVLSCLVQMLFLQLTYIENLELPRFNSERERINSIITEVLKWREGKYLTKMCFTDNLDEAILSCINTKLQKLMNLTVLRYFATQKKLTAAESMINDKFLTGILTAYSKCLMMFDKNQSYKVESSLMTTDGMQCLDQYVVRLIQSSSQVHMRKIDKDLLLRCGPTIAECAINSLKS